MAKEEQIQFSHPRMPDPLRVRVKPNSIEWSYRLNTANFPTYGGEVIQILSVYIDDMTITGNTRSYAEMENVVRWFTNYIQYATQGKTGRGEDGYDSRPVTMSYPERGWVFELIPKALPSFKYGRDITVPEWSMTAAVAEPQWGISQSSADELKNAILQEKFKTQIFERENIELFGKATVNTSAVASGYETAFNFSADDPFSGPTKAEYKEDKLRGQYDDVAEWFNNLIPSYLDANFEDLSADFSKPTSYLTGGGANDSESGTDKAKDKAKNEGKNG